MQDYKIGDMVEVIASDEDLREVGCSEDICNGQACVVSKLHEGVGKCQLDGLWNGWADKEMIKPYKQVETTEINESEPEKATYTITKGIKQKFDWEDFELAGVDGCKFSLSVSFGENNDIIAAEVKESESNEAEKETDMKEQLINSIDQDIKDINSSNTELMNGKYKKTIDSDSAYSLKDKFHRLKGILEREILAEEELNACKDELGVTGDKTLYQAIDDISTENVRLKDENWQLAEYKSEIEKQEKENTLKECWQKVTNQHINKESDLYISLSKAYDDGMID